MIEPDLRRGPDRRKHTRGGRRATDIPLRDPDACPVHGSLYDTVIETRRFQGYKLRRHCCTACNARWNTYETRIDPRRVRFSESA
jgi:hypothetical protein